MGFIAKEGRVMLSKIVIATHYETDSGIVRRVSNFLEAKHCHVLTRSLPSSHSFEEKVPALDSSIDLVIVVGGDGSMLSAAELVYGTDIPLLGINTGHIGFLTQFEIEETENALEKLLNGQYILQKRSTEIITVYQPNTKEAIYGWSLNEMTIEKDKRGSLVELCIGTQDVLLESFGADGVIVATPTGSTAYAFSANGPILFPSVEAIELVPLAAHTLFGRPLIGDKNTVFKIKILDTSPCAGWITCDGRRSMSISRDTVVHVQLSDKAVSFVQFDNTSFAQRLVSKFNLPIVGWRQQSPYLTSSCSLSSQRGQGTCSKN